MDMTIFWNFGAYVCHKKAGFKPGSQRVKIPKIQLDYVFISSLLSPEMYLSQSRMHMSEQNQVA